MESGNVARVRAGIEQTEDDALASDLIIANWTWGTGSGRGVKVAVIDSGIDVSHPAVGSVAGFVDVINAPAGLVFDTTPHNDLFGHGTACAGVIRALAPDCELYSVRVLGPDLIGRGNALIAGIRWAIDAGMHICNLSLGTTRIAFRDNLQELVDLAFQKNVVLVAAANNQPQPSYPSVMSSVISVAAQEERGYTWNPAPPPEFGAPGVNIEAAGLNGGWNPATGNSIAAPHITGLVAQLLGKHPGLTPSQVRIILRALATNVKPDEWNRASP